ncbi:MAG TPA: hypothetical protein VF170_04955, partial [Planctomycetaceae bacterium]
MTASESPEGVPLDPPDAAPRPDGAAGRLVGGVYETERCLRRGGGTETWLARDVRTSARVVLKAVEAAALPVGARLRLEHEQSVLGTLQCGELAPFRQIVRDGGRWHFVRSAVPGRSLRDRLSAGPLTVREAVEAGRALVAALAAVHAAGVFHR